MTNKREIGCSCYGAAVNFRIFLSSDLLIAAGVGVDKGGIIEVLERNNGAH